MNVYKTINDNKIKRKKQLALLIDPDKTNNVKLIELLKLTAKASVDFIFVGGSFLTTGNLHDCISIIKDNCSIPVIIFPGSCLQISEKADALLFLSLISGRNADLLIGNHVIAAPLLKQSGIEVIPTGYMLVESGKATTVSYMSNSFPIPHDKNDIAAFTALAGEMLGLKMIYIDAGSGAQHSVSENMIASVSAEINVPLIAGGGIKTPEQALKACKAGADMIVIGNAVEKEVNILMAISDTIHNL